MINKTNMIYPSADGRIKILFYHINLRIYFLVYQRSIICISNKKIKSKEFICFKLKSVFSWSKISG